ncbi:uncharacterized protein LOC128212501 [Mya arenaria]|uniref:uncharacterized protein LOC128212501 n=1 Tax=Mya arenaria TaxID=6604 RepID=UPI0022E465D3|nr:uncharacterized protein LOC128212501 [Mya arenaria]
MAEGGTETFCEEDVSITDMNFFNFLYNTHKCKFKWNYDKSSRTLTGDPKIDEVSETKKVFSEFEYRHSSRAVRHEGKVPSASLNEIKQQYPEVLLLRKKESKDDSHDEFQIYSANYSHVVAFEKRLKVIGTGAKGRKRNPMAERQDSVTEESDQKETRFFPISKSSRELHVVCNDILEINSDCIVNPCVKRQSSSIEGRGELFRYLKSKGGQKYEDHLMDAKIDSRTQCAITDGGDIKAKIIHPTRPVHNDKDRDENIFMSILGALQIAEQEKMNAIAFPFAYSGTAGVDLKICAFQYARAVTEFCRISQNPLALVDIYFVEKNLEKVTRLVDYLKELFPQRMTEMMIIPKPYDDVEVKPTRVSYYNIPRREETCDDDGYSTAYETNKRAADHSQTVATIPILKELDTKPDNDCVAGKTHREVATEGGNQKEEYTYIGDVDVKDADYEDSAVSNVVDYDVCTPEETDTLPEPQKDDDTDLYEDYTPKDNTDPIYETVAGEAMPTRDEINENIKTIKHRHSLDCKNNTTIKVLEDDIRIAASHIIVCPEYKGKPEGGVFGLSVKFSYWKAAKLTLLKKVNAEGRVARSKCQKFKEYQPVKFLYHVNTPIWRDISDNTQLQKSIKSIFLKLNRFQDKERSIAIPLLGVVDVEEQPLVRDCCRVFVESVIKCCRERNSPLPLDVYLVNSCPTLTSWITEDLATFGA